MKKYIILLLSIGLTNIYGQNNQLDLNYQETVIAPNVDATALFKFNDIPVNLATGLANVNIPLYNIALKDLSIPVVLNYHNKGIQVSEIASSSGLGWSLNYGGMVSRQVRDKADDSGPYGYLRHTYYKDILNSSTFNVANLYSQYSTHYELDLIPDRFFFNIGGESGEFIFDQKTGDILKQSFTDIEITAKFKNSQIVGWLITDTKGNQYHFGIVNTGDTPRASTKRFQSYRGKNPLVKYTPLDGAIEEYYDSWYLVKVENYFGEAITFTYEWENVNYHIKQYDKRITQSEQTDNDNHPYYTYYARVTENSYSIKTITYPLGKLVFTRDTEFRKDLNGGKAIKSIRQYNKNNELLSGYDFTYSYTIQNSISNTYTLLPGLDPSSKYRMFLKEVQQVNSKGEKNGLYSLEYNPTLLPNRFSTSKDLWGYYNGKPNGTAWVLGELKEFGVNGSMAEAGILTGITYPTGRKEKFIYEDNTLKMLNERARYLDAYEEVANKLHFNVNPLASEGYEMGDLLPLDRDNVFEFTLPTNITRGFYISFVQNVFQHSDYGPIPGNCHWSATLYQNGVAIKPYIPGGGSHTYIIPGNMVNAPGLQAGQTYTLKINGPMGGCGPYGRLFASCRVEINWFEKKNVYETEGGVFIKGAGRRIKQIETYDHNQLDKVKSFEYTDSNGKSSGKLFGMPPYNFIIGQKAHLISYAPFGMEDSSPVSGFRHNSMVYSDVTEYLGTKSDNQGKINYTFTDFDDGGGGYYEWPFYLAINKEWKRGLPLTTQYYKKNNGIYVLEREEINTYRFFEGSVPGYDMYVKGGLVPAPGTIMPPFPMTDMYDNDRNKYKIPLVRFYRDLYRDWDNTNQIDPRFKVVDFPNNIYYKRYYLTGGRYYKEKTEITDYTGSSVLKRTIVNQYPGTKHYFLTAVKETDPQGNVLETSFKYAPDITGNVRAQKLSTANRIADPVKVENFRNTEKTYSGEQVLKDWGNNLVDVESVKEYKGSQLADNPVKILHKDNQNGNTLEVESAGLKTVYLYGYNKSLLIAQIENASKEEVASALGVTVANLVTVNETKLIQINNLRTHAALKNAMITTYEHKPLVGVTKITDAKGLNTYYEYDDANRLQYIKDDKGNVLQQYEYNYKNN